MHDERFLSGLCELLRKWNGVTDWVQSSANVLLRRQRTVNGIRQTAPECGSLSCSRLPDKDPHDAGQQLTRETEPDPDQNHLIRLPLTPSTMSTNLASSGHWGQLRQRANSFVFKILPVSCCSSKIFLNFGAKSMIPIYRRGGGGIPHSPKFPFRNSRFGLAAVAASLLLPVLAHADALRGTLVRDASIHVAPDANSAKLGHAERGYELVVIDASHDWAHVEAILREPKKDSDNEEEAEGKTITGWVSGKALVTSANPNGDKIVFGEAADSEDEASRRRGRRDAAQDAMRLYYRVYDLFPNSPLAAEGLYRAGDIRWQMERNDVMTRPSARERDSYMRGAIDETWMKLVIKKFPGTKWADLAAFHLIENKLCGDWQGASKCPDKEADLYESYAKDHPQSPAAAEALYDAAWRRSALIEIYKTEPNQKKSAESKDRAQALAQKIVSQYGSSDWTLRAERLIFYIQQGVPTYGNAAD